METLWGLGDQEILFQVDLLALCCSIITMSLHTERLLAVGGSNRGAIATPLGFSLHHEPSCRAKMQKGWLYASFELAAALRVA